jgi:peptidyl-prolyl cis-trans isomerase B (cyclophilin B)
VATNQQRREAAKRKLDRQIEHRKQRAQRRKLIGALSTVGVVLIAGGLIWALVSASGDNSNAASTDPSATPTPPPPAEVQIPTARMAIPSRPQPLANPISCEYPATPDKPASKPVNAPAAGQISSSGTVNVTMKTTAGDIPVTLDRALAPCTVNSFLDLSKQGYFTDTSCHRLVTEGIQILQCGDPTGTGTGGPGYSFKDEVFPELKYGRGVLAMANSGPNTNGSQFFLVYGDASQLTPDYTVFGSISDEGLAVLDKVAKGGIDPAPNPNDPSGTPSKPNIPVTFTAVTVAN